jgi:hypothetical protein
VRCGREEGAEGAASRLGSCAGSRSGVGSGSR